MSRIVYADHAATTALSDTALKAMLPYFNQSYGNPSSLYSFAQQAKSDLEAARAQGIAAHQFTTAAEFESYLKGELGLSF